MKSQIADIACKQLVNTFGASTQVLEAYAPGRVNIIGEHTDYNNLPVLPIATEQRICIVASPCEGSAVSAINMDPKYTRRDFEISADIPTYGKGDWGNYLKAACQAIWLWCEQNAPQHLPLRGGNICVAGDVPEGAGLSSSSATVVVMALTISKLNGIELTNEQLAAICAEGEQYVGTRGGGMDQAASLLSLKDHALCINFNPLRTQPYSIPSDWKFVVAHSMVVAEKSGAARDAYNSRVSECRIAIRMLNKLAGLTDNSASYQSLGDFLRARSDWQELLSQLPDGPVSLQGCADFIGMSTEELLSVIPVKADTYQPKKRATHVLTEGLRVQRACEAMHKGDIDTMGMLMNASHDSCANDYEISCDQLNTLVTLMRSFGAVGSRLTGAGFGGCTVSLAPASAVNELMAKIRPAYYAGLSDEGFAQRVFVTSASAGANADWAS